MLAGVIGGLGVAGVAAVVSRDHQDIAGAHFGHEPGQPVVELGSSGSVTGNIAAVAVQHVEVDQVDKGKTLKIAVGQVQRDLQALGVAAGADGLANALAGKNVVDLAHADGGFASGLDGIEHRITRRNQAVVVAARGAGEVGGAVTHKRAGDDATHTVLAHEQFTRLGADLVKLFNGDEGLVGGNLENAVC